MKPRQRFHDKTVFPDASLPVWRACLMVRFDTENALIFFPLKKVAHFKNPHLLYVYSSFW
jgi:hypothetical protein